MKNLIFSIEELSKRPLFCIFTIIQLTISFVLIFIAISSNNSLNEKSEYVNKLFNDKKYYVMDVTESKQLTEVDLNSLLKLEDYIEKNNIDVYSVQPDSIFISKTDLNTDFIANFDNQNLDNKTFQRIKSVFVNQKYLNDIGIALDEGSYSGNDESKIPVILGNNYKGKVNLHDTIPYIYTDEKGEKIVKNFEACGFAKKDSYICSKGDPQNIINIDNYIIVPMDLQNNINNSNEEMIKKINIFNYYSKGYFNLKDSSDVEKLEKLSTELGLNYKFKSIDDVVKKFNEDYSKTIIQIKVFSISMLLFTVISIIMVMLSMVMDNIKEFAINMLVGASINDIILRIFNQILLLFILGVSATLAIVDKFLKDDIMIKMNFVNVSELLVFAVIICILVSIIPIVKFKNISIDGIIKGSD